MCGYVGEISLEPGIERRRLYRMNNVLLHRGPDESGIEISPDRRWGVAHRRLCVVDIAGGKQPMIDVERGLTLVYNGEIYDHDRLRRELETRGYQFKTQSDTEVVLALYAVYGLDFFEHLRGEFSFALIDERRRRALLVRDRMGLKPLFYVRTEKSLIFASEIKALFRSPDVERRLDPKGFVAAIAVCDTPGRTAFAGIQQVRNAHFLEINLDTLETSETRYWDAFTNRRLDAPTDPRAQVEAVRAEVETAVRLRLRADVPVGTYLSGGIDSSLVTAVMARQMDRIDAFGLAFDDSPRHNEFHYAEAVARQYENIRLHRISITSEEMVRRLPETVWHLERPFGNLHSVAKIMQSQFAREHVVCVLTGDGGDEAFCGYSTFWLQNVLQQADYSLPRVKRQLDAMLNEAKEIGSNRYYLSNGLAKRIGPETQFMAEKLGFRPCDLATSYDSEKRLSLLLHPDLRRSNGKPAVASVVDQLAANMPSASEHPHATLLQYIHLNTVVPEYIATIADRAEWAGSVEARPPLFDHKVVELAMGLPLDAKLKGDREKHVLREAFADILPREVLERRKQAFLAPSAPFHGVAGRALLDRYLSTSAVKEAGIWDHRRIALMRAGRRAMPKSPFFNLVITVALTAQILYDQFIKQGEYSRIS